MSSGNLKPTQLIFGYILMMFSSKLINVYGPRNIFRIFKRDNIGNLVSFFCKPIILNQSVSMSKSRHRLRQKLSISIASVQNLSISITEHLHFIHTQRKKNEKKIYGKIILKRSYLWIQMTVIYKWIIGFKVNQLSCLGVHP